MEPSRWIVNVGCGGPASHHAVALQLVNFPIKNRACRPPAFGSFEMVVGTDSGDAILLVERG
jgi:hypothetical protein